jgi:hypothetical protein
VSCKGCRAEFVATDADSLCNYCRELAELAEARKVLAQNTLPRKALVRCGSLVPSGLRWAILVAAVVIITARIIMAVGS